MTSKWSIWYGVKTIFFKGYKFFFKAFQLELVCENYEFRNCTMHNLEKLGILWTSLLESQDFLPILIQSPSPITKYTIGRKVMIPLKFELCNVFHECELHVIHMCTILIPICIISKVIILIILFLKFNFNFYLSLLRVPSLCCICLSHGDI